MPIFASIANVWNQLVSIMESETYRNRGSRQYLFGGILADRVFLYFEVYLSMQSFFFFFSYGFIIQLTFIHMGAGQGVCFTFLSFYYRSS